MRRRAFVVGGGLAGLSAALHFLDHGVETILFEASAHLGGRCRSFEDPLLGLIDNGTHALVGANRVSLDLLGRLGVRDRWHRPEANGVAMADLAAGAARQLGGGLGGLRRAGLRLDDLLGLLRLMGPDRPVSALFDGQGPFYRNLVVPLTLSALNTEPERAASRLLGHVMRKAWRGLDQLMPLVAERGCGPDLVEPLAREVARLGGRLTLNVRVTAIERRGDKAVGLVAGGEPVALEEGDMLVLAVPPDQVARLLQRPFPFAASPIINAHFLLPADIDARPVLFGVLGGTAQWILARGRHVSVIVSAADVLVDRPVEEIALALWPEARAAFGLLGTSLPDAPVARRIIKERRATVRQTPGLRRPGPTTEWTNIALAGDWTDTGLPATIEGALLSGRAAARTALGRVPEPRRLSNAWITGPHRPTL